MDGADVERLILGKVSGVYGIKGWVKVYSHTRKKEEILGYSNWLLGSNKRGWEQFEVEAGRPQGKTVVAKIKGCDDRNQAESYIGREIAVLKSWLPSIAEDEYYWHQLQGLQVKNLDGFDLGTVKTLMETGANDVLVLESDGVGKERLIPFVQGLYVLNIDLESGEMQVDWDPEF